MPTSRTWRRKWSWRAGDMTPRSVDPGLEALTGASADIENALGLAMFRTRRFEDALAHHQRAVELDPDTTLRNHGVLGALLILGRNDEAQELLALVETYRDKLDTLQTAWLEALQGDADAALTHLASAVEEGICKQIDLDDPAFDGLRDDPRFQALGGQLA